MDFKSTIIIFGAALIFIPPLIISSPISGAGRQVAGKSMGNESLPKSYSLNISMQFYFNFFSDICFISFQEMFVTAVIIAKMDWSAKEIPLKILDFV